VTTPPVHETITWIRLERPTFDLVGVLITALGFTAVCVGVAVVLGSVLGWYFIHRNTREGAAPALDAVSLHL
jgi:hypothetical protein